MAADTRDRIINASAELFRRNGYTGTGLKQIVAKADAPFGSVYHFFPGGKSQLGEQVIRQSGRFYLELVGAVLAAAEDVVTGVHLMFVGAAATLRATDYADACPIAVVALEVASTNDVLREATADVFESWIAHLAELFEREGVANVRARELAIQAICALEGAFILSRAMRTTASLEVVGRTTVASVGAAIAEARRRRPRRARSEPD